MLTLASCVFHAFVCVAVRVALKGDKGMQSVVSPGTAKNCLCVGAVANVLVKPEASKTYYCPAPVPATNANPFAAAAQLQTTSWEDETVHMSRLLSYVSGSGYTYDTRFKPVSRKSTHTRRIARCI